MFGFTYVQLILLVASFFAMCGVMWCLSRGAARQPAGNDSAVFNYVWIQQQPEICTRFAQQTRLQEDVLSVGSALTLVCVVGFFVYGWNGYTWTAVLIFSIAEVVALITFAIYVLLTVRLCWYLARSGAPRIVSSSRAGHHAHLPQ